MRKSLLLLQLAFHAHQGVSQIDLEAVYQVSGALTQLENSGPKCYVMDRVNTQCRIYNMDHSLSYDMPDDLKPVEVQWIDIQGRVLGTYPVESGEKTIRLDVTMYPRGVYLYRIIARNVTSENSRLILQ